MPPKKPNVSEEDAFSPNAATVRAWLEAPGNTAKVNRTFSSSDGKQHSMLYRACRFGHFEVARLLVEDFGADVNVQNGGEDKSTPLHGACYGGSPRCVALLVHNGAGVGTVNAFGESPLDNAKSPAHGVKKAFATKCQKLLKDSAACAEQLKVANASSVVTKTTTTASPTINDGPVVGSKTKAASAEAEDAGKPAKKAPKLAPVAAPASGPHPFTNKTVVFSGTFKSKKKELEARVAGLGGKTSGSVSGKTDYVVKGSYPGDKEWHALCRGLPVWTEEQFEAVCTGGWSAVPPPPPVPPELQSLAETTQLEESYRKALIGALSYTLENDFPLQPNRAIPTKGTAPPMQYYRCHRTCDHQMAW